MNLRYQDNCNNVPWDRVVDILQQVGMSYTTPEKHKKSFESSYAVIFAFDSEKLVAMGRILSDGVRQSAMYDIAIDPSYQGKGIGQKIVADLLATAPDCNCILYASPGKEGFYNKLGFKKMKTGMALFLNPQRMIDGGFVEE